VLLLALAVGCNGDEETGPVTGDGTIVDVEDQSLPQDFTVLKRLKAGLYTHSWELPDASQVHFVLNVPPTTEVTPEVPLVLALHFGAPQYPRYFGTRFVQQMVLPALGDEPAIVVAPDVIGGNWTNERCERAVIALTRELIKTYDVDPDRVLVTGYSLGARGAWHLASRYPDIFTGAIPLAGGPPENMEGLQESVPVYCVQSVTDEVFPIEETRQAVAALKEKNLAIEFKELDQVSHYESLRYVDPFREALTWMRAQWEKREAGK
jgi:predicted peptidase